MRVLYASEPISDVTQRLANGQIIRGSLQCTALLWDPNEAVASGHHAELVSRWRSDPFTQADGSMRVPTSSYTRADTKEAIPAVVIPAEVFHELPDDARLEVGWSLRPGAGQ